MAPVPTRPASGVPTSVASSRGSAEAREPCRAEKSHEHESSAAASALGLRPGPSRERSSMRSRRAATRVAGSVAEAPPERRTRLSVRGTARGLRARRPLSPPAPERPVAPAPPAPTPPTPTPERPVSAPHAPRAEGPVPPEEMAFILDCAASVAAFCSRLAATARLMSDGSSCGEEVGRGESVEGSRGELSPLRE